jgi:pre-mRNA cleavage complex 2 protein Pcf11
MLLLSPAFRGMMTNQFPFWYYFLKVPPWMKLPAFYLLDAISKNVYDPYARFFTPFVIGLFLETYHQVDQATRSKMEEMLLTWRSGGPNGKELFGIGPQVAIERGIWGNDAGQNVRHCIVSPTRLTHVICSSPVLRRDRFRDSRCSASWSLLWVRRNEHCKRIRMIALLKIRLMSCDRYAFPSHASMYIVLTINQLRALVDAGVSQAELQQILTQLRTLARASAPPPPPPPPPQTSSAYPQPVASPSTTSYSYQSQSTSSAPRQDYPPIPPQQAYQRPQDLSSLNSLPVHGVSSAPANSTGTSVATPNLEGLFSALVKAGVVSSTTGTPTGAGATAKPEESKPDNTDSERETSRRYRKQILRQKVKLTSVEITRFVSRIAVVLVSDLNAHTLYRHRAPIVEILYDSLPSQCKQCGIRFAGGAVGKKALDDHLDIHFRQNRKASQNVGRGHSRSWFISIEVSCVAPSDMTET